MIAGGNSSGPRVVLTMPGYGEVTSGAARGFWRATRLPEEAVYYSHREGSLLAANFNAAWCDALNLAAAGSPPAYFAMQHADIEPADWWLDSLIADLENHDLDVLGVAVPIKDDRGLTSTALARPDGDTWRVLCRLTTCDVRRLPETFTSDDVGHPLLLNTGLWVCRFDLEWARQVRFTINDRIIVDRSGRYVPQCEPEDWYFSRLLHELGLRVGCTSRIKVNHRGPYRFANDRVWGESFDREYVSESPLPESTLERFVLPDITGWLTWREGRELARLAVGRQVLEIGSYYGLSTVCMAREARHVTAVDWWDGRGTRHERDTLPEFVRNIARHGLRDRVRTLTPDDDLRLAGGYDLAFVDGGHDRASVDADIAVVSRLLSPDGVIVFHDYRSAVDPDVTAAVDAFVGAGAELVSVVDTLAVVRPSAAILEEV